MVVAVIIILLIILLHSDCRVIHFFCCYANKIWVRWLGLLRSKAAELALAVFRRWRYEYNLLIMCVEYSSRNDVTVAFTIGAC